MALGPDVVLVERSVARKAQDELLERGISLTLNMKRPVLDFIARCTGAEVGGSCALIGSAISTHWSVSIPGPWCLGTAPTCHVAELQSLM